MIAFVTGLGLVLMARRVRAKIERRVGPPILQPIYDIVKLYAKKTQVSHGIMHDLSIMMLLGGFFTAEIFLPVPGFDGLAGEGDLITLIYIMMVPMLGLALGVGSCANPNGSIGISRALTAMLAYDIPFIIAVTGACLAYGTTNLIEIVQIQQEMLTDLKDAIENVYGITIETLGIKQLKVNEAVTEKVFERMRAARNLKTEATIAEGEAEATKITTDAVSISQELMAAANARAKAIQGRGDAEAAQFYEMLKQAPQFAISLKNIEALKTMFKDRTTVVLPMDAEPINLLKEMPDPTTWGQVN